MSEILLIASDHAGYELKQSLINLMGKNFFKDLGTNSENNVDYPDYSIKVVDEILNNPKKKGILICGSGIGMSISANRYKGIRASLCHTPEMTKLSREHNDANIIALGSRIIGTSVAKDCLHIFLSTPFENTERHLKRITKLD